jgi:hypothetical protein
MVGEPVAALQPAGGGRPDRLQPQALVASATAFLARLAALRSNRGQWVAHPFAVDVSEILRGYLEARYAFSVRFQTSREFLELAATDPRLNPDHRAIVRDFLGHCDLLKFARGIATESELAALIDTAERFIRECAGLPPGQKGGNP